ncbi:MAG: glycosyltransferase [Chthoniobacterales bacterium]
MSQEDQIRRLAAEADRLRAALDRLQQSVAAGPKFFRGLWREKESQPPVNNSPEAMLLAAAGKIAASRTLLGAIEADVVTLRAQLEQAEHDCAEQKARRADATSRLKNSEQILHAIESSPIWKTVKPLWKLISRGRKSPSSSEETLREDLDFGIDSPTDWTTKRDALLIRGWCCSRSGRVLAGIRAKIGRKSRFANYGLRRHDLSSAISHTPAAARCGFTVDVPVPKGASTLRLEAIEQGGNWEPFFEQELHGEGEDCHRDVNTTKCPDGRYDLPYLPSTRREKIAELLEQRFYSHHQRVGLTQPLFSIITPTYNAKAQWLGEAALSVLNLSFSDWEWCIVDDGSTNDESRQLLARLQNISPRLRVIFAPNGGISAATNRALDLATGEFVCFLDHDDLLHPHALGALAAEFEKDYDAVYSDEDKLDDATRARVEPFYKPDWSPEYFRGVMYVGHLLSLRRDLAQRIRFDSAFDGVQDFEFMLRISEAGAKVGHTPELLYHWRKTRGSIAQKGDAKPAIAQLQERAVNAHLTRLGLPARACQSTLPHRLQIVPLPRTQFPKISIIIPTKNAPELLGRCLRSLFEITSYPDFEVLLIDNQTTDEEAMRIMREFPVRRIEFAEIFNFSRANNEAARNASGAFLVFLNNDTEIIKKDWLEHLLYYAEQQDVGAAGGLLLYPDRTVQHAGVALGMRGTADHLMRGFPSDVDGYAGSLACAREVSAVTAACMMIRKALFDELHGFNEHFFTIYQDLDLCLRLRDLGLRIIQMPQAVALHHESVSRKTYYDMVDRMLLLDQWEPVIERGDPYYNRNLDLQRGDYAPSHA